MKIVGISGSRIGTKTRTAMNYTFKIVKENSIDCTLFDLAEYDIPFSDGRHYLDYEGETSNILLNMMEADAIIIGTPIFQASIPASLKNIFDLLPVDAFQNKVVSMVVTAGSAKHYLIGEQQLKPILGYMKAQLVQNYVFIEDKDFYYKQIINEDVAFRIDRLVEDTIILTETYAKIRQAKEEKYGF